MSLISTISNCKLRRYQYHNTLFSKLHSFFQAIKIREIFAVEKMQQTNVETAYPYRNEKKRYFSLELLSSFIIPAKAIKSK